MALKFDPEQLLCRLEPIKYEAGSEGDEMQLEQSSLGKVLLTLAEVDHEREYELCRGTALHLIGEAKEPEDINLD